MKLCIKIYGVSTVDNKVKYSAFSILPYKSKNNKPFSSEIWNKKNGDKIVIYMKLNTSYNDAKNIANNVIHQPIG